MRRSLEREFLDAYIVELARVIGALLESPAHVETGWPTGGPQWLATIDAEGGTGTFSVAIDRGGALAAHLADPMEEVSDERVAEILRDIHTQVLSALSSTWVASGVQLAVAMIDRAEVPEDAAARTHSIVCARMGDPLFVTTWGAIQMAAETAPAGAAQGRPGAAPAGAVEPTPPVPLTAAESRDRIEVILDIELPLTVRFGRTELPLRTLTRLGPGSVIDLDRSPDDPVELLVSDHVVARGEVVVVAGNYGIRILDVVSANERARVMEV